MMNQKSKIGFLAILAAVLFGTAVLFRFGNFDFGMALVKNGGFLLPLVFAAALLDSVNPCAFSILILTVAFLFNLGRTRPNVLKIGGFYILGIFIVYVLIGLGILRTLDFFNVPHFLAKIGALIIFFFGAVNIINVFFPNFPIKLKIPESTHRKIAELMGKISVPASFLLGGLVGLYEFPCTGGPYLFILSLLHDKATFASGFGYLIFYNFVFVLPLVIILFVASDKTFLPKIQSWRKNESKNIRFWSGIAMLVLAAIIFIL